MKVRIAEMEDFNQLDKLQKEAATRLKIKVLVNGQKY